MSKLTFKFEADEIHQKHGIEAIVDIFDGQAIRQSNFTALLSQKTPTDGGLFGAGTEMTELGVGNRLDLKNEDLLANVRKIQDRFELKRSTDLMDEQYRVPNFAIEMETGTGKTYVYTRTIFELNKRYGFRKFIIVVPSVAIREGIKKSLEMTEEHFHELYPGQALHYFIYDSARLNDVQTFATSDAIEVMIINIQAFKRTIVDAEDEDSANNIYKETDQLQGRRPIDFITQTNPIVIIDEPQSVDNTDRAKESITALNPLCILRYSATHRKEYNLMYKLGPIEAYEKKLVKAISVLAMTEEGDTSLPHMKLIEVTQRAGSYSAKIEMFVYDNEMRVSRKNVVVNTGKKNDLFLLSKEYPVYAGLVVINMDATQEHEYVEFEDGRILTKDSHVDDSDMIRAQIRATIETHLDKEVGLVDRGIKVLSLFFIDKVANYRQYEGEGDTLVQKKGPYAVMFEEEYLKLIALPKYPTLFTSAMTRGLALNPNADEVHKGYFSIDKNKFKDTKGDAKADESTYDLIMKDKEKLVRFDSTLRFIFSHSALKEGWDNPNVFQICTLVETQDPLSKRQKVGRGLRLPVNQDLVRVRDERINVLTVVANESYKSFAEGLQHEIESETNTKFGVIAERQFETIRIVRDGVVEEMGYDASKKIHEFLKEKDYLDKDSRATTALREAVVANKVELPPEHESLRKEITESIKTRIKRLPILNEKDKTKLTINKEVFIDPEFVALWDSIKWKTVYRLAFDSSVLIEKCTIAVRGMSAVKANPIIAEWVDLQITTKGVEFKEPRRMHTYVREHFEDRRIPDLLQYLETTTRLKRDSLAKILTDSGTLDQVEINPQAYLEQVASLINIEKRKIMLDGIKYERIGEKEYYGQELFEKDELIGYLKQNALATDKSVYSHVLYDSMVEKSFAERLNYDDDVKLYAKLPSWFRVETPLGDYNPDWAIVLEKNGAEKLYFVVETKGSTLFEDLRATEEAKTTCGRKHFEALGTEVKFDLASDYAAWRKKI